MAILILLCIVISVLFISYYINKQEWWKESEVSICTKDLTAPFKIFYNALVEPKALLKQLKHEMLPSAPITDIETFKNFCKMVSEKVSYEDYEIQNCLFLKRSK